MSWWIGGQPRLNSRSLRPSMPPEKLPDRVRSPDRGHGSEYEGHRCGQFAQGLVATEGGYGCSKIEPLSMLMRKESKLRIPFAN